MTVQNKIVYIENGDDPDIDEVMSNDSFILNNMINFALDGADTTNQNGLFVVNSNNGNEELSYNRTIPICNGEMYKAEVYDTYGTNDYTDYWSTTGSPTIRITEEKLSIWGGGTITSNGSSHSFDLSTEDNAVKFKYLTDDDNTSDYTFKIYLTDGSNDVELLSENISSSTTPKEVEIVTDVSAETCNVWKDGTQTQTNLDLSSITGGNYYLKFNVDGSDSGDYVITEIYDIGYASSTTNSVDIITKNIPVDTNVVISNSNNSLSGNFYYYIDGGSSTSFTAGVIEEETSFNNIKFKENIDCSYTINTSSENIVTLTNYKFGGYVNDYLPNITDEASGDTTHDPDSFTNPENAFDDDSDTYAFKESASYGSFSTNDYSLGKTFTSKSVKWLKFKAKSSNNTGGGFATARITIQTYDGSSWNDYLSFNLNYDTEIEKKVYINTTCQGARLNFEQWGETKHQHYLYYLKYGDAS